jgi:hypothetical protein
MRWLGRAHLLLNVKDGEQIVALSCLRRILHHDPDIDLDII